MCVYPKMNRIMRPAASQVKVETYLSRRTQQRWIPEPDAEHFPKDSQFYVDVSDNYCANKFYVVPNEALAAPVLSPATA